MEMQPRGLTIKTGGDPHTKQRSQHINIDFTQKTQKLIHMNSVMLP